VGERKFEVASTKVHIDPVPASRARRIASIVLLSFLCSYALSFSPGCGNDDQGADGRGHSGFSGETVRRLDEAITKQMREEDLPGVVVGVWVPGEGRYVVAKGKANLETGEKRDLADQFRIGSITKTFVATAVLQLVEEGKLSKTDKLSEWFPDFPNAEKITIEHLLRMQSGIVGPEGEPEQYRSTEEVIEASAKQGILFGTPGQRTEYSDINYILLGEIIRKVSGNDTGDQIEKSILEPLGMKDTVYPTNNDLPGDLHGYTLDLATGELKEPKSLPLAPVGAARAMISDVSDLKTWAKAVCTGKLLKPDTQRDRLRTQHLSGEPDFSEYGEGILKWGSFCGHPGIYPGFNSQMWYLPEKDATIIVNVNRFDPSAPPPAAVLFETITKILFPKYVEW
jgi:D-alanyl-D-alanine carboxypeptidase